MQIGEIDAAERACSRWSIACGSSIAVAIELIEVDVLDVEGLAHVRAARAQQPCHLFLIAGAVELRLHRVRRGGDLTERQRQGKILTRIVSASGRIAPATECKNWQSPLEASSSVSFKRYSQGPYRARRDDGLLLAVSVLLAHRGDESSGHLTYVPWAINRPTTPEDCQRRSYSWNALQRNVPLFTARSLQEEAMNGIIYLIGLIVVILAILSFFGLR